MIEFFAIKVPRKTKHEVHLHVHEHSEVQAASLERYHLAMSRLTAAAERLAAAVAKGRQDEMG